MYRPSQHDFSKIPQAIIQRSSFNRSHPIKTTFDVDNIVPIFFDEALPGDTFNCKLHAFCRLATPLKPFMDNLYLTVYYFAVANRLVWNNWEKFNGAQDNPGDSTDFLVPQIVSPVNGWAQGSLQDYLSWPTVGQVGVGNTVSASALYTRAYNLIWNNWFRDENLQNSAVVDLGDGPDASPASNYVLLRRGKRHDYFTSCLPWPQKGPAVDLPLGTSAPVYGTGKALGLYTGSDNTALVSQGGFALGTKTTGYNQNIGFATAGADSISDRALGVVTSGASGLYTDLSAATVATINTVRQAFQIQKLYERDARGGSRYTEILRAHFGVVSPDARLQRPEYLGGSSSRILVHPVQQTSSTDATSPQGNLAAFGIVSDSGNGFSKSFTEHTLIIGLVNIRADLTYQQGVNRMFSRRTRWDFYWPALAHLGEQAVLNKEIYAQGTSADNDVFGYQERYAEYRYRPSQITGQFRSTYAQSLDVWHLSQEFGSLPALNSTFIVDDPPLDRCVAVPSEPHILFDAYFDLICARPMPVYGVPGLVDHF